MEFDVHGEVADSPMSIEMNTDEHKEPEALQTQQHAESRCVRQRSSSFPTGASFKHGMVLCHCDLFDTDLDHRTHVTGTIVCSPMSTELNNDEQEEPEILQPQQHGRRVRRRSSSVAPGAS